MNGAAAFGKRAAFCGSANSRARLPSGYLLPACEKGSQGPRSGGEMLTFRHQGRTTYVRLKRQPGP
jgi:hypothetical protein